MCRVPTRRTPRPAWVVDECRALGHRIASVRVAAQMSQDDLAERAGVERRSIQRYESGRRDPRYADLLLIAYALDVQVEDLVRPEPRPASTGDGGRPGR
ncbi:helix-turn-helix transcriptional regulator [Streptomyces sp. NPDC056987]|uniref:helix-turn-helix transcriptional regulator n=1 Tax=Streptomyces sp. NPDC056987 TaxID=3345988 RepID=UPI00362F4616